MTKIGVFGGTFDPPHNAHFRMSKTACELYGLDQLIFVPVFQALLQERKPVASPQQRVEMLELMINSESNWIVDTGEIEAGMPVPTIATLKRIQSQYQPAELYLIIGADQGSQFHLWQSADEIIDLAKVVCFGRENFITEPKFSERMLQIPYQIGVSSGIIREQARGDSELSLTLPDVADYIIRNNIYK